MRVPGWRSYGTQVSPRENTPITVEGIREAFEYVQNDVTFKSFVVRAERSGETGEGIQSIADEFLATVEAAFNLFTRLSNEQITRLMVSQSLAADIENPNNENIETLASSVVAALCLHSVDASIISEWAGIVDMTVKANETGLGLKWLDSSSLVVGDTSPLYRTRAVAGLLPIMNFIIKNLWSTK